MGRWAGVEREVRPSRLVGVLPLCGVGGLAVASPPPPGRAFSPWAYACLCVQNSPFHRDASHVGLEGPLTTV